MHSVTVFRATRFLIHHCHIYTGISIANQTREPLKLLFDTLALTRRNIHLLTLDGDLHSLPSLFHPIQHIPHLQASY